MDMSRFSPLANMILALAERDADLFRELSVAAGGNCNSADRPGWDDAERPA